MRPDSIRQFDYFYGASAALGLLNVFAGLGNQTFGANYVVGTSSEFLTSFVLTGGYGRSIWLGLLAVVLLPLVVWYFAAIRASRTARWVAVVRAGLGALRLAYLLYLLVWLITAKVQVGEFSMHVRVESWIWYCLLFGVVGETLHLAAVYFLFAPDSRDWYLAGGPAAAKPEEVFG